ncbi:MAG: hypothetical protein AAF092_08400 [Pseudomonadota bacterium]
MKRVLYGFDPLCGWCFGLIPAWRHFAETRPKVAVDVLPGGLITGARVGPYRAAAGYIRGAAPRMAAVTGQEVSEAFFALIEGNGSPISASAPPSHALLQAPAETRLDFAHALQEAHFRDGRDIGAADVLADVAGACGLIIDATAAAAATDQTASVAQAFARARALGISSFPTTLILLGDTETARIDGIYDPAAFASALSTALKD